MVNVRSLSDEELHSQLLELGISMPVTATTRPLLLKKLLQAKQTSKRVTKAPQRIPQRNLQAMSSDEEEEEEEEEDERPFAEDEVDEGEDDYEGEEEELELSNSNQNHSGVQANKTSGNASVNKSSVFKFNNNSIVTSNNAGHYTKKNGSNNNLSRRNTPSHIQARTSTPSSLSNRNLGRTNTPAHALPRPTLDYDTASDNEDILNSTLNDSHQESFERKEPRPNRSNLFSRVTSGIFPSNNNDSSSHRKYTPTRVYSSFRSNESPGRGENGSSFRVRTPYRYEDTTDFRRSPYTTFRSQNSSRDGAQSWSWAAFCSLFKASKPSGVRTSYNTLNQTRTKSSSFSTVFQKLFSTNNPLSKHQEYSSSVSSPSPSPPSSSSKFGCPGIPSILLLLLFAFFLLLGMSYINMVGPSAQELLKINNQMNGDGAAAPAADVGRLEWEALAGQEMQKDGQKLPICLPDTESTVSSPCLGQAEVAAASKVLSAGRRLVTEAERRYSEYQCGGHSLGYLAVEEMADWLEEWGNIKFPERAAAVSALAKLAVLNPVLGLEPVYSAASDTELTAELQGLRIKNPKLHLLCAVMNLASLCFYCLALLAVAGGVFYGVLTLVRQIQRKTHFKKQQMFWLVHEASALVKSCPEGFIAVQHVRDHLLSPKDRLGQPGKVWRDAEDFIDHHESRMVREVRVVGGEETEVWRWIGQKESPKSQAVPSSSSAATVANSSVCSTSSSPQKTSLYPQLPSVASDDEADVTLQRWWQGAGVSRKRSKVQAPTRCLKIRNCPFSQTSPDGLQQELVHRCQGNNIMHMALETDSPEGIVYIMAENAESAGNIHSLLHGCWFGGLLLSVKFVREERYLERFPNATRVQNPLRTVSPPGTLTWSQ